MFFGITFCEGEKTGEAMGECRTGNKWSMFPTDAYLLFGRTWEWAELDACTMRIRKMGKRGRWLANKTLHYGKGKSEGIG